MQPRLLVIAGDSNLQRIYAALDGRYSLRPTTRASVLDAISRSREREGVEVSAIITDDYDLCRVLLQEFSALDLHIGMAWYRGDDELLRRQLAEVVVRVRAERERGQIAGVLTNGI